MLESLTTQESSSDRELSALFSLLPDNTRKQITEINEKDPVIDIALDYGLPVSLKTRSGIVTLQDIAAEELIEHISAQLHFGNKNRAGIDGTLHRVSCIKNRDDKIIGLTLRVGKPIPGASDKLNKYIEQEGSILLLGKPGAGKTTLIRDIANKLSATKRVIIIDNTNEIAGSGDIPHYSIGAARRMQVAAGRPQGEVMLEAVENHTPDVVIIDEISTEIDVNAARTVAERGVRLIATAHGTTLAHLIKNPVLNNLVGGIVSVTLGDEEAKARNTSKTVLERRELPSFETLIELKGYGEYTVHEDVAHTIDDLLLSREIFPVHISHAPHASEIDRMIPEERSSNGERQKQDLFLKPRRLAPVPTPAHQNNPDAVAAYLYGLKHNDVSKVISTLNLSIELVPNISEADIILTARQYLKGKQNKIKSIATSRGIPIVTANSTDFHDIYAALSKLFASEIAEDEFWEEGEAMNETRKAIEYVRANNQSMELAPRRAYIRRLQHQLISDSGLRSHSIGNEPNRKIKLYI